MAEEQAKKVGAIYAALAKIMSKVEPIKKEKTNQHQNYKFRGIDQFYNQLQKLFADNKVMCVPKTLSRNAVAYDSGTKKTFRIEQEMEFKFLSLEDGSFEVVGPLWGEAMDTSDKASNKANSAAAKYALMMAFMVPTEDLEDGDKDNPEVPNGAAPESTKAQPQKKAYQRDPYIFTDGGHRGKKFHELFPEEFDEYLKKLEDVPEDKKNTAVLNLIGRMKKFKEEQAAKNVTTAKEN